MLTAVFHPSSHRESNFIGVGLFHLSFSIFWLWRQCGIHVYCVGKLTLNVRTASYHCSRTGLALSLTLFMQEKRLDEMDRFSYLDNYISPDGSYVGCSDFTHTRLDRHLLIWGIYGFGVTSASRPKIEVVQNQQGWSFCGTQKRRLRGNAERFSEL